MIATTKKRPVHLNLALIHFPAPAVMSGAHRISGVLMIFTLPFLLRVLDLSLSGAGGFAQAKAMLQSGFAKLALFLWLWALSHHFLAGLRYLAMDIDLGVELEEARKTAWAVMFAAPLLSLLLTWGIYA